MTIQPIARWTNLLGLILSLFRCGEPWYIILCLRSRNLYPPEHPVKRTALKEFASTIEWPLICQLKKETHPSLPFLLQVSDTENSPVKQKRKPSLVSKLLDSSRPKPDLKREIKFYTRMTVAGNDTNCSSGRVQLNRVRSTTCIVCQVLLSARSTSILYRFT